MELRHLRYFVAVAQEMNFRRAAKTLHIAQPPLSMQIRVLENELGVQLFERSNRAIRLTPAGTRFLVDARRVLEQAKLAEANVKRAVAGLVGKLSVGFMVATAHDFLSDSLRQFRSHYPDVQIELYDLTNSEQLQALEHDRIDIAFTRTRLSRPNLASEIVSEEPMILMVPTSDPLAKKARVDWSDLNGKSIITLHPTQSMGYYDSFFEGCRKAGIAVTNTHHANEIMTEMWLVSIGLGYAPTSVTTSLVRRPDVSYCQLPEDLPKSSTSMSWRTDHVTPILTNFLELIRKNTMPQPANAPAISPEAETRSTPPQ